jgi:hypothetical protein
VDPTFGVTKNPNNQRLQVFGENFECPAGDCSQLKVRFRNAQGRDIFTEGRMEENGAVSCLIPKYPAPETLDVDVSFNDQDFTNNGVKFGYHDPFIDDVQPRLLSAKGTTVLKISGYGFVQLQDSKDQIAFQKDQQTLNCTDTECTKSYTVQNENLCTVGTFPREVKKIGTEDIGYQPFTASMMAPDGSFVTNDIQLRYYRDPQFLNITSQFAYANEEKPVIVSTEFYWEDGNNYEEFRRNAVVRCRFTSNSFNSRQEVTDGIMEHSAIGSFATNQPPNQIRCRTPKWGQADQT